MEIKGTTIVGVKRDGHTVIAGDGQVTAGQSVIMKGNAVKVRRLYNDEVIVGFAGTVADAFMLSENSRKCSTNTAETLCAARSLSLSSGAATPDFANSKRL